MNPELKAQDCTDHDPIEDWRPANPAEVDYWLCLHIGAVDEPGAELFYVNVLSETAAALVDSDELALRKTIVLKDYSWNSVVNAVEEILQQISGESWEEMALQLSRRFDWEFENYSDVARVERSETRGFSRIN